MPEKLKPIGKPNFSSLQPTQVRVSSVIEIGAKYPGKLPDLVSQSCESCQKCEGCESCQKCEGCQSCQKSRTGFILKELGIATLSGGPVKVANDVIYELIQEADAEHGKCEITQSRVIIELPQKVYDQLPGKDKFVEIGTTKTGAKQYLLKETQLEKGK